MPEYYTEETVVQSPFLFVSYKHDDKQIVHSTVDRLISEGVQLWYDADLHNGDNWISVAERLIRHENCVGVIFFNSASSYISKPVASERQISLDKYKSWQEQGKQFRLFVANIGKPSTMRLLKQVLSALPDDDTDIGKALCVELGTWKDKQTNDLPGFMLEKDGPLTYRDNCYIVDRGTGYCTRPVQWLYLYGEDETVTLIAKSCIDSRNDGAELLRWLKEDFLRGAFTPEQQTLIAGRIGLLSEKDIEKAEDPAFLKNGVGTLVAEKYWWLADKGSGALQKVVREDGSIYGTGYNSRTKKCGVRPVIRLQMSDLKTLIEK